MQLISKGQWTKGGWFYFSNFVVGFLYIHGDQNESVMYMKEAGPRWEVYLLLNI